MTISQRYVQQISGNRLLGGEMHSQRHEDECQRTLKTERKSPVIMFLICYDYYNLQYFASNELFPFICAELLIHTKCYHDLYQC